MTDDNGQKNGREPAAQDSEPKVSKPYIMPDDPEELIYNRAQLDRLFA